MKKLIYKDPVFIFLQSTLDQKCASLDVISRIDWDKLLVFSKKQAIMGIVYEGVQMHRLQYPSVIDRNVVLRWFAATQKIRRRFSIATKRIEDISLIFEDEGFRSCILKGLGLSLMYPVHESRTAGDIDIWVEGKREAITKVVRSKTPNVFEQYHHIDFPIFKNIPVEVHYLPSQMSNPIHNRRLQNYYRNQQKKQFENKCPELGEHVCVPTNSFNAIFLLSHMMRHFFNEGIGLRQFVDYYYLLKQGFTDSEKNEFIKTVRYLGMAKFAGAVMWIEENMLGLDSRYLLMSSHEKAGWFLFEEIMGTGNFGYYDTRYSFRKKGSLACALTDIYRDFLMARMFPSEALWKPIAKLVNQQWKIKHWFLLRSGNR